MSLSLYTLIESSFPDDRTRLALEVPGRTHGPRDWSFDRLSAYAARYAALFAQLGLKPGDRIALQVEKSPEALVIYLACLRGGFVFLPMNTAYRVEEVDYLVGDAEPALIVCDPAVETAIADIAARRGVPHLLTLDADAHGSFIDAVATVADAVRPATCGAEDLAVILYTSGTTGKPKGAMLTHGNLAANGLALRDAWRFTDADVLLHALPIFHAHGLFVACHCALLSGAKMIWRQKFDRADVIALLPRATTFMGVPTFYTRLLAGDDFNASLVGHMRLFTSGSAPLLAETFEAFRARTGHAILERYGMTETGMNTSNPYDGERRAGTVGFPLPDVELRVTDEEGLPRASGEIGGLEVRGPNVFSGYWRMPEKSAAEFAEGGWFRTGDIAMIDADGYVHLVGRAKDLIISGGFNVYPKEIEELVDDMAEVLESAIVGVPHSDFGEASVAVVVLREGAALDEAALIARLREKIANYKVPKRAFFVESLPRNTMGKVQKNLLREDYKTACA
ncbi:malonyl-CoA synthase [Parvibaculum sp.]|uniref:malonate--CoA ligase n=1 Tax=Parvibaculum sp. TaxID=2024848 RepID=UPI001DC91F59|nr:malonyl-CoA synthase [Parvibaculum sp.]MBX3490195.1 malonyl-CoA synthase [Parvibaculum sp.]MCW5725815.1 malonyl-CoA synthase [Parvibaculum sp.]